MVTKQQPSIEPSYEEQVAAARASLDRHIAEVQAERARALAQGIDPEAELQAWVRENFTREALLETWREHLAERGKRLADDLAESGVDMTDAADARTSH